MFAPKTRSTELPKDIHHFVKTATLMLGGKVIKLPKYSS